MKMYVLRFLLAITLSAPTSAITLTNDHLRDIFGRHFQSSATMILQDFKYDLDVFDDWRDAFSVVRLVQPEMISKVDCFVYNFIISFDNTASLITILQQIKSSSCFRSRAKYLWVCDKPGDLTNVAEIVWKYRLYRSVLLVRKDENITLHQIDLAGSKCGTNIQTHQVKSGRNLARMFDPNLKKAFRRCSLKVIYSEIEPWIIKVDEANTDSGIYLNTLNLFAETSGFNLIYLPENPVYQSELQGSYSFDTVHHDLEEGTADIYVGLGDSNVPQDFFDVTTTIYDDNLYWVVPKAGQLPYWKANLKTFTPLNWIILGLLCCGSATFFCIVAYHSNEGGRFKDIGFNILFICSIFISYPNPVFPKNSGFLKGLVCTFSFSFLIMCVAVQGKLFDNLRNPLYDDDITNLDLLLDSGLPMKFADGLSMVFLFVGPQHQKVFDTYVSSNSSLEDSFKELDAKKDFATIIDKGLLIKYPNIKSRFNVFGIAYFKNVFYMRKNHELFRIFRGDILRIVESGFVNNFVSAAKWKYVLKNEFQPEEDKLFKLNPDHILGAVFLYVVGHLLAAATFLAEVILAKILL